MQQNLKQFLKRFPQLVKYKRDLYGHMHRYREWWYSHDFTGQISATTSLGYRLTTPKYTANRLMLENRFEEAETQALHKHILECDVFVDIGSNIGFYACMAGAANKQVVAFEPQPRNLRFLYKNIQDNHITRIECYPIGLAAQPGLLTLYGASGPSASLLTGWAGYSDQFKQIIPVNTLDNILGDRFVGKQLVIKIDVEGAEYGVMQGALKTINLSPKPIWFLEIALSEFHPDGINPHYQDIFQFFWDAGYTAMMADSQQQVVTPSMVKEWIKPNSDQKPETFNYIFTPNRK